MSWFFKLLDSAGVNMAQVNSEGAVYSVPICPSGQHFAIAAKTGTIAAAAAAGAAVFAMRVNPGSTKKVYVDTIKLRYTTIVAYTVPITQTRALVITRGAGAASSGGTAIAVATKKDSNYSVSETDTTLGGDARISTTGALTVTGLTWEATNFGEMTLAHVGTAGAFYEHVYEFATRDHPIELNPGEVLGVRVGANAMDAAGTWSLGIEVRFRQSATEG